MGGSWTIKAAIYPRPSAVSLEVWLYETSRLPPIGQRYRAHSLGWGCSIILSFWERRSRLRGMGHGALMNSWDSSKNIKDMYSGATRRTLCVLLPDYLRDQGDWGNSVKEEVGPVMGLPKDLQDSLNCLQMEYPLHWGDIAPGQHVCSLVHPARHMRCSQ